MIRIFHENVANGVKIESMKNLDDYIYILHFNIRSLKMLPATERNKYASINFVVHKTGLKNWVEHAVAM